MGILTRVRTGWKPVLPVSGGLAGKVVDLLHIVTPDAIDSFKTMKSLVAQVSSPVPSIFRLYAIVCLNMQPLLDKTRPIPLGKKRLRTAHQSGGH